MGGPVIALLGAAGTGKTTLAAALAAALTGRGQRARALPAPTDETPEMHRQRIETAAGDGCIVLADTPPSWAEALLRRRGCDAALLMGLDLGAAADAERHRSDAALRALLDTAGIAYAVVYGHGEARVGTALAALAAPLGLAPQRADDAGRDGHRPRLRCRDCLVPGCEHLLFSALTRTP